MSKSSLIEAVAKETSLSKAQISEVLEAFATTITKFLKKGEEVNFPPICKIIVAKRPASVGRNPRTGETIQIKARKQPKFKAAKALKDALN
ncbi:MAG: HU family DNA-binding protein [Dongiaceae bacterium]